MFYRTIRLLFRCLARPYFRFKVRGVSMLPATGPGIVIAAHRSWLDPAAVGGALPRPVRFLIRDRVYHKSWARWFYRSMGGIPVSPGGREAALALREALRRLHAGELVGIFPEGGLRPEGATDVVFPGAAMLAVRGNAPIIPVSIRGSAAAWPPGCMLPRPRRVEVEIGRPIEPPAGRSRGVLDEMVRRIEGAIREMGLAAGEGPPQEPPESAWTRR